MGRKQKFSTDEERRLAQNEYSMNYYERNKEKIKQKNLERYHKRKPAGYPMGGDDI